MESRLLSWRALLGAVVVRDVGLESDQLYKLVMAV